VPGIAVVHLVRRQNGLAPLERFLASYREHAAGVAHELVILFKGFRGESGTQDHDALLEGLPHRRLFVPDRGFDLNAYFIAVERLDYDYFCFLNSYCRILDRGWLEKMSLWIGKEGVGLVGATGSCQSIAGGYSAYQRRTNALPPAARFRARITRALRDRSLVRRTMLWALRAAGIWRPANDFPPFPNCHLRTNAFMGSRQTLRRVELGPMRTKLSAYRFESGYDSLTNQVLKLGLKVLVVGSDGEGYEPERWHLSNTFWQSREENLLVADNQTETYLAAAPAARIEFAQDAWGQFARPA
jgi:hypothetical protein